VRTLFCLLLIGAGVVAAMPASAHTRSESHSAWTLDGPLVHMAFSVADLEADRISGGSDRPDDAALIRYLDRRVGVSASGTPCRLTRPPRVLPAAAGFRRVEFQYLCASTNGMQLRSTAFFDLVPSHIHFAQVQRPDGEFVEEVLAADHPVIDLRAAEGHELQNAGFSQFLRMGVMHIFTGLDHLSFLIGLVLISRRLRDLVFVITGFTIGHSLTLALAVTGLIRPHAEFIDALVALTIALIGAENIVVATRRPRLVALWTGGSLAVMAVLRLAGIGLLPPLLLIGSAMFAAYYLMVSGHLRDAGRVRLVVTLVFGLIHGFGFAADLLQSRLPPEKLAQILLGFNLGVEVGQLAIVVLLTAAVGLLVRLQWSLPRPIVVDVTASLLVAIGTYWFIGRSFVGG
jgi:hypothetical protein